MPIYDYHCQDCNRRFEALSSVGKRQTRDCECGAEAVQVITTCAFNLDPVSGDFPTRTQQWANAHESANWDDLCSLGLRESKRSIFL